jgi:hypothetical protein
VDVLSDYDRQRLEDLDKLIRDDLRDLNAINRQQAVETRRLERRRLDQEAEHVRESYNSHREEYTNLLRQVIPTQFAPGEQALIRTVMQRLDSEQVAFTHTALQEAERDPDNPAFTQLLAQVVAIIPAVQQRLAAKNTPSAHQLAQAAQVLQAPTADLKQKLKLSVPLIPFFLSLETELNLNIAANLKAAWERLRQQFHPSQA